MNVPPGIPLHITQTNKPGGVIEEVRVESTENHTSMTAIITPIEARWFMDEKTAHFFTKIAGISERIPVIEHGDKFIKSKKNKYDADNLLNLPDIEIEPGIDILNFQRLQRWVEQEGVALAIPKTFP